mgnify:CR=1 FL=1|tara:strand:+ start:368 stop:952 length:585 start_codon:yes stop_codon:yes gene_type:complete
MLLFLGKKKINFFNYLKSNDIKFFNTDKNINNKNKKFFKKFKILISFNYKYKIEKKITKYFHGNCFNCHISYLPWNAGANPNFWSFRNNTKKGITIHLLNEKIDKGPIIFQKRLYFNKNKETLKSSYFKLNSELENLLIMKFEKILYKNFKTKKNLTKAFHKKKEFLYFKNRINKIYNMKINILLNKIQKLKND